MKSQLTIAIDGYSGCGKSTIAKDLAKHYNYLFIDTGAMYRGITLYALENDFIQENSLNQQALIKALPTISITFKVNTITGKQHLHLNNVDVEQTIREPHVAAQVSQVATIKEVREKLVAEQRILGQAGGVVMDGRDIGSVVFPNADLKLFVTADPTIRAQRRLEELQANGVDTTLDAVLKNLLERDEIDRTRKESPLIQTPDANVIDTTNHTRESQLEAVLQLITEKFAIA